MNVLHLLLPAGEVWFVKVYQQALPLIRDERLGAQVCGFMGQEATHSRAHAAVLGHLREQGIETADYTRRVEWMFNRMLGMQAPRLLRHRWLQARLAIIAAIEHFTCVLGNWVLAARALDESSPDPVMLDLLRWHGAEEVEHRSVAFDVLQHLGGRLRYPLRVLGMLIVLPVMIWLWARGVRYFAARDPALGGRRFGPRDYLRAARQGRAPGWELVRAVPRYLRPRHHPCHEGSLERALDYLARSPAARSVTP